MFAFVLFQNQPARIVVSHSFGSQASPSGLPSAAVETPERAAACDSPFQAG